MALLRERKRKRAQTSAGDPNAESPQEDRRRRRMTWTEPGQTSTPIETGRNSFGSPSEPNSTNGGYSLPSAEWTKNNDAPRSDSNPYSSAPSSSFMARSRYFEDTVVINEDQARSYPTGDADGPTEDDIQLLRLQGAFDLPPRSIRDGLINTFMERCSPWMPIIERSWLEESGAQKPSILLLQSVFVAASRVTSAPSVTAYASTRQFYRRAKALFWSGYEKNPVTVVAAVCILHWYNPEGPEHVSTNTSGFWRYVGVGLAHQVGLHKEPTNKRDAALRRRLWWTLFARDCLISAGQGRPLAVDIEDCELAPPCMEDFHDSSSNATLFIAYVEISSILGHLTQCCRRKALTRQVRQNMENRLYRWIRGLDPSLRLYCEPGGKCGPVLASYNFEARQLHIPYLTCLAIMFRPSPGDSPAPAVVLASSMVARMFEDFLARDEIQFLGPIFTFHLLAAGIGLLSSNGTPVLWDHAVGSMQLIYLSLEELAKRWSSAKGSLRALKSVADKQQSARPDIGSSIMALPREQHPFFDGFGSNLSWAWEYYMPMETTGRNEESTGVVLHAARTPDQCNNSEMTESRPPDATTIPAATDDYRPLTTILDPNTGFAMGDMSQDIASDDFFHNQYQGMGDWLFKDLDWSGDITW
ncbi:hypothetical protein N7510_002023 [Penicillium lagena]|uniref:uncharacterized protein n=1 Tax=Penicillium lagena TaxID=94218 RepID=UPI0025423E09|nr:uncharacterized protein N7510_002023 [Penicillium lagena]KAJ5625714.1 hypothetical protein N7510_002023 [Penicillium lagena]